MLANGEVFNGLEIFIDGPVMDSINAMRKKYDPTVKNVDPHITLAYPPFIPYERWMKVKPDIVSCLQGFTPFRIVFREAGTFAGDSPIDPNVLWLKPEDGGTIISIRKVLEKRFPKYFLTMPFPFVPHLSIGFIQGNNALQRALVEVQASLQPFEFTVREIVYEAWDEENARQFFDRIPLGGQC